MSLWKKLTGKSSPSPLLNEAVFELCIAAGHGKGHLGLARIMPPLPNQRDAIDRCEVVLPEHALVTVEIVEYQWDFQGGSWPTSYCTIYRGASDFGQLSHDLHLLQKKRRRDHQREVEILSGWKELRVWIGSGEEVSATHHLNHPLLAHSLSITATFQ